MVPAISAHALLVWFVWGLFMALGWVLGTVVMESLLGFLGKRRNRLYDFLGSLRERATSPARAPKNAARRR